MKKVKEKKEYMSPSSEIVAMMGGTVADITSWNPDYENGPNLNVVEGDPNADWDGHGAKEYRLYDAWNDGLADATFIDNPWK